MMKRMISMLLALVMVFTAIPWTAVATEEQSDVTVQSDNLTVEGSNGVGNLLSAEIEEVHDTEEAATLSGCVITDLVVDGNTATVSYDAAEAALLVVALYSEDGLQMLTSASAVISAESAEASISFAGEMPDYFLARAYLVDPEDASPKSQAYETPVYTQAMQELLNSTVDDYDPTLVLNFDDDPTTNFAVYHEGVIRVEETEGANTVVTNDDENLLYVIENADETFTTLQPGDVVSYFYGEEELLLCKVASVTVDGTTVTIHGDGALEMEEVFDHLKLDIMADNSDMEISGTEEASAPFAVGSDAPKLDTDTSIDIKPFRFEFLDQEEDGLSGYIDVLLDNKMDFLYSRGDIFYRWELEYSISGNFRVTLENENDEREYSIPVINKIKIGTVPAVGITFKPQFVIKASCSVTVNTTLSGSIGINCATGRESINISKPMKMSDQLEIEGKLFIGFDLKPGIYFLHDKVFYIEMNVPVGGNITGSMTGTNFEAGDISFRPELEKHDCGTCIKGEIYGSASIDLSVKFFNKKNIELGGSVTIKFLSFPFYWSLTYGEMGWGKCPHKQYLVTVEVVDTEKKPVEGVRIFLGEVGELTDAEGIAQAYLPAGTHNISAEYNGQTDSWALTVSSIPSKLKIILGEDTAGFKEIVTNSGYTNVSDSSGIIASGQLNTFIAGQPGLTWTLYTTGYMHISGQGTMFLYEWSSDRQDYIYKNPWDAYKEDIRLVIIADGVTSVGRLAFYGCNNLVSVTLPDSIQYIDEYAFDGCPITNVHLSDDLKSIGTCAFQGTNLTQVTVPDQVRKIEKNTFRYCDLLETVHIGAGVSSIAESAFYQCDNLKTVTGMTGVTSIGDYAFFRCEKLSDFPFTGSLKTIGVYSFNLCALTQAVIPDSVTGIGEMAFNNCSHLQSVSIGDGVEVIREDTFYGCSMLENLKLGNHIYLIDSRAFIYCQSLSRVTIPASVEEIEHAAFNYCTSLQEIRFEGDAPEFGSNNVFYNVTANAYYPSGNATWTTDVMQDYGGALTWVPYTPGEAEGAAADTSAGECGSGSAAALDAVYGGEYASEDTGEYILRTASFSGLVPGEEYLLLAMASIDTDTPLDPQNLLYVDQAAAGEDGSLTFTYVQRITTDPSYVVVSGPARKSLADAVITFPEMTADGALHTVNPTVVYDGVTLQEGRDYVIMGTVSYTGAGTYVCFIRGIHNYSGTMKCTYTVAEAAEPEKPEVPTDPTDPTDPTNPEEPTDPVDPEEPALSGVIRIAGADRIDTSLGIADQLKRTLDVDQFSTVIVASALNFPDALTGSYLAAVKSAPILLTYHAANEKIAAYIGNNLALGGTVYILGGSTAVSDDFEKMVSSLNRYTVKRLAGSDRFGTNLAILEEAGVSHDQEILICTATGFADSLSASAAGLPILLAHGTLGEDQKRFLEGTSGNFVIIGGTSAVSSSLEAELDAIGDVERVAGENRYQTSVKVAKEFVSDPDAVVLAYARNFPDGLCGGPLAIALNAPLVLTDNYDPSEADTYVSGIRSGVVVGDSPLISDAAVRAIFDMSSDSQIIDQ